jgi:LuxR family transcriptional regulator, maltose regulon positive regulatory protein
MMADKTIISQTKIITPSRQKDYLSRPRLLELLSDLLDFKLILIAAPAGYGKTSLLVDFVHHFNWPVCWFTLEPIDQDFTRFISHFIASIRQKFPGFGSDVMKLIENVSADEINLDFLITSITNSILDGITEHFVIVLDDYHLLQSDLKIDQFLSDFVQRVSENCHIAITSRKLLTLPDLPLMVARSQVGGLSIDELSFQVDEISILFNQKYNKPITKQQATDLSNTTEGWITGLLLTSQTLNKGMGDIDAVTRASGIGLYEYLAQQVLDQQPYSIQEFLLNTSILEEFNADLCASVLGGGLALSEDWNKLIDHIVQNNLFVIQINNDSFWIRYHHLFRDFLRSTIEKQRPEDARKIKLDLALYFEKTGEREKAFNIYKNLGEKDLIVNLIASVGSEYLSKGKIKKLSSWFSAIPENYYVHDSKLLSISASISVNQGKVQEGCIIFDNVIDILREGKDTKPLADNLIRRSIALRLLGNYEAAMRDANEAISLVQKKMSLSYLYSEALRAKGIILWRNGKLKKSLVFLEKAIKLCEEDNRVEDIARIHIEIGAINEELGQFSIAEKAYNHSLAYFQSVGDSISQPVILNNLGVLLHSTGDFIKSFQTLEKSMHYSQITGNKRMEGFSLASIGDLYRDISAFNEASNAYQRAIEIAINTKDQILVFYVKIAQARLSSQSKNVKKAQMYLDEARTIANRSKSLFETNKLRLEQSILDFWNGDIEKLPEDLRITTKFFVNAGYVEDATRNQFYLFLSYYMKGNLPQAMAKLECFISQLNDANYYVPSMSAILEARKMLPLLFKNNDIREKISDLKLELDRFQKQTQKARQAIRRQASVVTFSPANIIITTFGTIEVLVNNKPLSISDWKTQTSRDLFLVFLAFPEGLTKEEIGLIFWPDASREELKLSFKNAIYRMRHAIGSDVVIFNDSTYLFNRSIDYEYDVENFIIGIKAAEEESDITKKLSIYKRTLAIYKGDYLHTLDQAWIPAVREEYLHLYTNAAETMAKLLFNRKEYGESLEISRNALVFSPFNEALLQNCMRILSGMGNKSAIAHQFENFQRRLLEEIGIPPSEEIISLYQSLVFGK